MRKIISVFIVVMLCFFVLCSCSDLNNEADVSDEYIVYATFNDYKSKDDYITFETKIVLRNTGDETVYLSFEADFDTEFKIGMIENRILTGYDPQTKGNVFMLPPGGEGLFEVWFSSEGNSSIKKPTKLTPDIICEEIPVEQVDENSVVINDSLTINGEYYDFSEIIAQNEGYVNISDEAFLEKAKEIELSMLPQDLVPIYGVEGYIDPDCSDSEIYYCFNDKYILSVVKDTIIVVRDMDTKQIVYEKE